MNGQYDSLTPEAMQAIMNTGDNDPEAVLLKQRQARQESLRRMAMQQPHMGQMAGQVFIPNLGGLAMQAGAAYRAKQDQPGLDQATTGVMNRTNDARSLYANKLMEALRRRQPQAMPTPAPTAGDNDGDEYGGY